MKEWLRVLPVTVLIFAVLTFLDYSADPGQIHWVWNGVQAIGLTAIGCVGQYLIHKNVLQDDDDGGTGCNCGGC